MKIIWAPWRAKYIAENKEAHNCFICEAIKSTDDKSSLILLRGQFSIVIMNRFPYNTGHVLVSPIRHIKFPFEMTSEEMSEVMFFIGKMTKAINNLYTPDGINIGVNIGKSAGAGEEHLHFHIVPRWNGDTNFITVFDNTRVLPSSIESTYKTIKEELDNMDSKP